jgi:hypothetical protein
MFLLVTTSAREAAEAMAGTSVQSKRVLWTEEEETLLRREATSPGFAGFLHVGNTLKNCVQC